MYYLKYRPQTIADLDNSRVKEIIGKVLTSKNLPHAFLFVGQKGMGKTSTARIISKAINCERKQGIDPCNKCKTCLAINNSNSPDVIELDAASNRGIDDIRNLIKESNFFPMTAKFRVFIIDEAHMITNEAFNALLKTLEEPPKSVIFILATTNQEKIPKTIASRCYIVNFGKAKNQDLKSMLNKIIVKEKIKIEEKLLDLIVKHSDHSFRDATKILEELITQNKISYQEGEKFLGAYKSNLLDVLHTDDLKSALNWIKNFNDAGGNFKNLLEDLLESLHLNLLANNGVKIEETSEAIFNNKETVYLMKLITEAYNNLRISPIESLPLEIAVTEFYNLKNNVK